MKFNSRHLNDIKAPLAILAAVVLGSAALVSWTRAEIVKNQRTLTAQESQLREARNRFQRSGDERDLIVRYMPPYDELRKQGLIGPEQRINWLDALRLTNQQARLFGAEYQVSTQQPYPYAQELNAPKLGMAQSVMKLSLHLAHEEELLRFFRLLDAHKRGRVRYQRMPPRTNLQRRRTAQRSAQSAAECELAWVTINPEPMERRP